MRKKKQATTSELVATVTPVSGRIRDLVANVSAQLGRPIVLQETTFTSASISGLWLRSADHDEIRYARDATPTLRTAIIAHELAHLLLGHTPQDIGETVAPMIAPEIRAAFLCRETHDDQQEQDAEMLATRLCIALERAAERAKATGLHGRFQ